MVVEVWLAFVLASIVLLVIPGPTVLTLVNYSLNRGRGVSFALVGAVALGDATALFVSLLGLGALLASSAFWFTVVKWLGGLYLVFLGLNFILNSKTHPLATGEQQPQSHLSAFWNTYLVTALNPKGIVFFVAFLPQFINPAADHTSQLWLLATTFVVLASLSAACYVMMAQTAQRAISSGKLLQHFHRAGGLLLVLAGLWSLTTERSG
ncbi:MAG: LysE family translocator [Pseudomonadota bacterium]